jgi:hypothetical protein
MTYLNRPAARNAAYPSKAVFTGFHSNSCASQTPDKHRPLPYDSFLEMLPPSRHPDDQPPPQVNSVFQIPCRPVHVRGHPQLFHDLPQRRFRRRPLPDIVHNGVARPLPDCVAHIEHGVDDFLAEDRIFDDFAEEEEVDEFGVTFEVVAFAREEAAGVEPVNVASF